MKDKKKIFRYLATGGTSFLVEYGSFLLLVYVFSVEPWVGQVISYVITLIVNFLLLRNWAFKHHDGTNSYKGHLVKYGLLAAFNLPTTTMLIYVLTANHVVAFVAKLIVIALSIVWNYVIYDKIIFRNNKQRI